MNSEKFNLHITTPEGEEKDPELIRLRAELMAIKPLLDDAIKRQSVSEAEELYKQAIEAKAKLEAYKEIKNKIEGFKTYELTTDPTIQTPEQVIQKLEAKGINVTDVAKDLIQKTKFSKEQKTYKLVDLTVDQLGLAHASTTDEIYAKAQEFGLKLCPAEIGPQIMLSYQGKDYKIIAMNQIAYGDRDHEQSIFCLGSGIIKPFLNGDIANSNKMWNSDHMWVFLVS